MEIFRSAHHSSPLIRTPAVLPPKTRSCPTFTLILDLVSLSIFVCFLVCVHPLFGDLQLIYFEFLGNRTRPLFTASPMSRRPNLTTVSPWKYPTAAAESPRNWRWVAVFSISLFFTPSFYQIDAQRSMRTPEHTQHCIHFERAKKTSLPPVLSRVPLLGRINRLLPANSVDDLHF